jgi:ketosteroid isomerase-like protein
MQPGGVAPRFNSGERIVDGQQLVEIFTEMWSHGRFDQLRDYAWMMHPHGTLRQPGLRVAHGREGFVRSFATLYALMPDALCQVHRSWAREDDAAIEFTLEGTLAGKPFATDIVDTYRLKDGLLFERVAYFDPGPLRRAILTRPRAWRHLPKLR